MKQFKSCFTICLLFVFTHVTLFAQDNFTEYDSEPAGIAYEQSYYTAHWSAYVPIALLVLAGIAFGIADQNHSSTHSSDYSKYNGLGPLRKSSSSSYSRYSYSKGSYSH